MNTQNKLALENIVGRDFVKTDVDSLNRYGQDWTRYYKPAPTAIVFPNSTEQVQQLVLWARQNKIPLIPSGGRTGLSGAAVAKNSEVVVSLDRLNRILDWNTTNMTVTVEAGVITEVFQTAVAEQGFYFPVDFASRGSSQIGGNIATNAGGIKVVRYGLMRDWVAGLKVVTGTGDILKLNQALVKNASGYDLRHLFVGSEGTLGFITEATLKYTHKPKDLSVLVLGVQDIASVMRVFQEFRSSTTMSAFELFTEDALKHVLSKSPDLQRPLEKATPLYVLIEHELTHADSSEAALNAFEKCLDRGWIVDGIVSQNETQAKNFWKLRENIAEALSPFTPYKNDISVTIDNVPAFMIECDALLKREYPQYEVVWFGHIGDGNLHISILRPPSVAMEDFVKSCQRVDDILFSTIQKYQGSISAEHGVGLSKKPFLKYTRSPAEIEIMRGLKKVFDPGQILNPGKIFDL